MKIIRVPKPSKKIALFFLLVVLALGIPLTIYQVQQQQELRQRAWDTSESAVASCTPENDAALIEVSFTNNESDRAMDVTAKDLQSGKSVDLGTIQNGETAEGKIFTEELPIDKGFVLFTMKWTDKSPGTESRSASYTAVSTCPLPTPTVPICPDEAKDQGLCKWDTLEGATEYNVIVKETESGDIIKEETVPGTASQSAFLMETGKTYQCSVKPVNACGIGDDSNSDEKTCELPTPTPSVPYCPAEPENESRCIWDNLPGAIEYNVIVIDVETGEPIKTETIKAPTNNLTFPTEPGKTYKCSVVPGNKCGAGEPVESEPNICEVPTPTPTTPEETPTPTQPQATPTEPIPPTETPVPTVPLPTPTPTVTPIPTATPVPTNTPIPTPTPTPRPTNTPAPTPTPRPYVPPNNPPQQPPVNNVAQQPAPTAVVVAQTTPVPTLPPTGDINAPVILSIAAVVMTILGAAVFFFAL